MSDEICREYKTAVAEFEKYCADEVGLNVEINTDYYPMQVRLMPAEEQQSMFDESEQEDRTSDCIVIMNGIQPKIKANLKYQMDAAILKKLITKVANLGELYLHAFRASVSDKISDDTSPKGLVACLKDLCNVK